VVVDKGLEGKGVGGRDYWVLGLVELHPELEINVWWALRVGRCGSARFPSLVRRGGRAAPWVVCSKSRSHLTDVRAALLLIGTFGFEQTAPALATRGHPRLTKAGNGLDSTKCREASFMPHTQYLAENIKT
jgi:hypothetical protein